MLKSFDAVVHLAEPRAVRLFRTCHGPLFLGEVATSVCLSLERTRQLLDLLEQKNVVRALLDEELSSLGLVKGVAIFVYVSP